MVEQQLRALIHRRDAKPNQRTNKDGKDGAQEDNVAVHRWLFRIMSFNPLHVSSTAQTFTST